MTPARSHATASTGLVNASAASRILQVHRRTVVRWVASGKIAGVQIGRLTFVPRAELERLLCGMREVTRPGRAKRGRAGSG